MHFFTSILAFAGPAKQSVCGIAGDIGLGGACKAVTSLPDEIASIAGEFLKLITNFGGFMGDVANWLIQMIFPTELQTWFFGTLGLSPAHAAGTVFGSTGGNINASNPYDPYHNLFAQMVAPGLAIAACASGARIIRTLLDQRATSMNVIVDVLVRFAIVAALLFPVGGTSLGYYMIAWAYDAVEVFSADIAGQLFQASIFKGAPAGASPVGKIFFAIANIGALGGLTKLNLATGLFDLGSTLTGVRVIAFIVLVPLAILIIYALILLIIRTILIGFCVALAPLCIATAAFDTRNKFFAWWLDIFTGSLAIAPILTLAFWIGIVLTTSVVGAPIIGPIIAGLVMCGSLWMAGKLIHQLTWKHFSHGGAMGAFGAAFGVVAVGGKVAQAGLLSDKLKNHPTIGPMLNRAAAFGYAAQGFFDPGHGGQSQPGGGITSVMDTGDAVNALSGNNGEVQGAAAALAPFIGEQGVANMPAAEQSQIGQAVADLINSPGFAGHVGDQFLAAGVQMSQIPNTDTAGGRGQWAQLYWNSLGTGPAGSTIKSALARDATAALYGATRGAGAGGGGGGGGGGGPAGGGGGGAGGADPQEALRGAMAGAFGDDPIDTPGFFGAGDAA